MSPRPQHAVTGTVRSGLEPLRAEFAQNFAERDELGAAFAVAVDGQAVVDLWGGVADASTGQPWARDTLQLIFSGSKGVVATALLVLVERAGISLNVPIARVWPEFASHGKGHLTLRHVVTFTAGLPGLRARVRQDDIEDPVAMAALLASQPVEEDPRAYPLLYGPLTTGWAVAEVVRRVDGRDLSTFFRQEVAERHGLDLHFGVREHDVHRVARTEYGIGFLDQFTGYFGSADPLTRRVWQNPMPFPAEVERWMDPDRLTALIPAINVVGTARDLARLYSLLAADVVRAVDDPPRILSRATLEDATRLYVQSMDAIIQVPMSYGGGGYRLRANPRPGPDGHSFGHDGGGGSANQAWPRVRAGISYVPNRLIALGPDDRRAGSLVSATSRALAGAPSGMGLAPTG